MYCPRFLFLVTELTHLHHLHRPHSVLQRSIGLHYLQSCFLRSAIFINPTLLYTAQSYNTDCTLIYSAEPSSTISFFLTPLDPIFRLHSDLHRSTFFITPNLVYGAQPSSLPSLWFTALNILHYPPIWFTALNILHYPPFWFTALNLLHHPHSGLRSSTFFFTLIVVYSAQYSSLTPILVYGAQPSSLPSLWFTALNILH